MLKHVLQAWSQRLLWWQHGSWFQRGRAELQLGNLTEALQPTSRTYMTVSMLLRSHSRPHQVPASRREKKVLRPVNSFTSPTRRNGEPTNFLSAPSNPAGIPPSERNPRCSHWRARFKNCATAQQLWNLFGKAATARQLDSSVVGAAVQQCGTNRWWDTLMKVQALASHKDVEIKDMTSSMLLRALAACVHDCTDGTATPLAVRKEQALSMSMATWKQMSAPSSELAFTIRCGSAWKICSAVGADAVPWAEEIYAWSRRQRFAVSILAYGPLLSLLEQSTKHDRVNQILHQIVQEEGLALNEVILGGLIEAAGKGANYFSRRTDLADACDRLPG